MGEGAGFTLQGIGPFLHWLTLGVLLLAPILIGYVIYRLGNLPGQIAYSRGHPQADAIGVAGWMGLITLVLWPVALVWAYTKTPSQQARAPLSDADTDALVRMLRQTSQRIADLEKLLPPDPAPSGRARPGSEPAPARRRAEAGA